MTSMTKIILAIVMVPIILILALPASAMLVHEIRLWVFARQLYEVNEFFEYRIDVLATGSTIYSTGNDNYCGFRAVIFYRHHESKENTAVIKNYLETKVFESAIEADNELGTTTDKYVIVTDRRVTVIIEDSPYPAGLDIRCW